MPVWLEKHVFFGKLVNEIEGHGPELVYRGVEEVIWEGIMYFPSCFAKNMHTLE